MRVCAWHKIRNKFQINVLRLLSVGKKKTYKYAYLSQLNDRYMLHARAFCARKTQRYEIVGGRALSRRKRRSQRNFSLHAGCSRCLVSTKRSPEITICPLTDTHRDRVAFEEGARRQKGAQMR